MKFTKFFLLAAMTATGFTALAQGQVKKLYPKYYRGECSTAEFKSTKYPFLIYSHNNCQVYAFAPHAQLKGDLRVAEGEDDRCENMNPNLIGGIEYFVVRNDTFNKVSLQLSKAHGQQLTPTRTEVKPDEREGVYYQHFQNSSILSRSHTISNDAIQIAKTLAACQRDAKPLTYSANNDGQVQGQAITASP